MSLIKFTRLVLLSMWIGAALFFGAVVAPSIFLVLRSFDLANYGEIAGSIVTRTLSVVNIAGFIIGLFLLLTFFASAGKSRVAKWIQLAGILVIIAATGIGQWWIAARMRALRVAMVLPIDQVRPDDPRRLEFNTLHGYSVNALGLAMIAALITVVLISRRLRTLN